MKHFRTPQLKVLSHVYLRNKYAKRMVKTHVSCIVFNYNYNSIIIIL
jgi:hypothetical protein